MFEVTKYEFPQIFVTYRRTGETYKFVVQGNGSLDEGADAKGDARQAALAYLAWFSAARARIISQTSTGAGWFT